MLFLIFLFIFALTFHKCQIVKKAILSFLFFAFFFKGVLGAALLLFPLGFLCAFLFVFSLLFGLFVVVVLWLVCVVVWLLCGCCGVVVWLLWCCCGVVVWLLCGCCGVVVVLWWCCYVVVVWLLCGCCVVVVFRFFFNMKAILSFFHFWTIFCCFIILFIFALTFHKCQIGKKAFLLFLFLPFFKESVSFLLFLPFF